MKKLLLILLTTFFISTSWGQDTIVKKDTTANIQVRANSSTSGAGMDIVVRGLGTPGNNQPLYFVDGVEVGYEINIDSSEVESISLPKYYMCCNIGYRSNFFVHINTKSGRYNANSKYTLGYPKYKKGSYKDFTKQIEKQLQPTAQKLGFTGCVSVYCTMNTKGVLHINNSRTIIEHNFKVFLFQKIESNNRWQPATKDGEPIEVNMVFEFEF